VSAKHQDKRKPVRKRKSDRKLFHLDKRADLILKATADADEDELLSPKEAARELGVSEVWLAKRRQNGDGPPYEVMSPRCIKYRRSKLRAWVEQRSFTSTAQYQHAKPGKPLKKREEARA
jgi:hypothetical protein